MYGFNGMGQRGVVDSSVMADASETGSHTHAKVRVDASARHASLAKYEHLIGVSGNHYRRRYQTLYSLKMSVAMSSSSNTRWDKADVGGRDEAKENRRQ